MPDLKIVPEVKTATFIKPEDALGPLKPILEAQFAGDDLGPSGPHEDDEDLEEGQPVAPPARLGATSETAQKHYTNMLDDLWPEFDDPEERTAARLESLLDEVADEAQRVHLLAQDFWENVPWYKVTQYDRDRYNSEFTPYLRRLNKYRVALQELEPSSTATQDVYIGLVKRAQGAGPVPDAIMHVYFAEQLGILADHAEDMSEGFTARVFENLERIDALVDDASDAVSDATDEATEKIAEAADSFAEWFNEFTRPLRIGAWIVVGSIAVIAGTVVVTKVVNAVGGDDE